MRPFQESTSNCFSDTDCASASGNENLFELLLRWGGPVLRPPTGPVIFVDPPSPVPDHTPSRPPEMRPRLFGAVTHRLWRSRQPPTRATASRKINAVRLLMACFLVFAIPPLTQTIASSSSAVYSCRHRNPIPSSNGIHEPLHAALCRKMTLGTLSPHRWFWSRLPFEYRYLTSLSSILSSILSGIFSTILSSILSSILFSILFKYPFKHSFQAFI